MNFKDLFQLLEKEGCKFKRKLRNLDEYSNAHNVVVEYKNKEFYIVYLLEEGSIEEATVMTYDQIYPDCASSKLVDVLVDYGLTKDVFVVREKIISTDDLISAEDEFKIIKKTRSHGKNFAITDILSNPVKGLQNLYDVIMKSRELFTNY